MKHKRIKPVIFVLFPVLFMIAGCAHYGGEGAGQAVIITTEAFKHFKGEFENTTYYKKHKPKTIAVLPFQDVERKSYSITFKEEDPAGVVRRGMYNHIASLPFKDLEIYSTDKRLKNEGLTDIRKIDDMIAENPKKLKSILGVDAAVSGVVTHFDRIFAGIYSQIAVGCEVKMWDLSSGEMLWRAKHVSRAHAGGLSLSPIGLIMATVASVWNLRGTEMLSQTDELFREIVSTIEVPESALAAQLPPPRIDLFAVMNSGKPFKLGSKAAFRLIGDPECSAYIDLGDFKSGIELTPVPQSVKSALRIEVLEAIKKAYKETGHTLTPEFIGAIEEELSSREIYEGSYMVESDEQAYGLIAKAYLVNTAGGQGTAIDAAHYVDIDSRPPQTSTGLTAESLDNKIKLRWNTNPDEDIIGYEIWSSQTPLSGYVRVKKSETNETLIEELPNFSKTYFQVRAVDKAENAGGYSKYIEAVPLPAPGLYDLPQPGPALSGEIREKVLLVAEKNPYTVLSDLIVTTGGVLYIAPGVEIQFFPDTMLHVKGGDLLAYGQKEKSIRFVSKTAGSEAGAWRGVILEGTKKASMRHVMIQGADTGLTIENSAPTITATTITGCAQAGLLLRDNAKPNITCSVFSANGGLGGIAIEGEGLAPVIRQNVFENNDPFQVQSYANIEIDLTGNYWGRSEPEADWFLGNIQWKPALEAPPDSCRLE
jgi:hypothetical protein